MDEFREEGEVYVATEDGSAGTEGNVLDAIRENGLTADLSMPADQSRCWQLLREYAKEKQIECWISMEERMACGIRSLFSLRVPV